MTAIAIDVCLWDEIKPDLDININGKETNDYCKMEKVT